VEFLLEFCVKSLLETFSTLHHYLNFMRNPKVDGLFTIYSCSLKISYPVTTIHDLSSRTKAAATLTGAPQLPADG